MSRKPLIRWILVTFIACFLIFFWFFDSIPHYGRLIGLEDQHPLSPSGGHSEDPTLVSPDLPPPPPPPVLPTISIWEERQEEVRLAFVHAFTGYKDHAFPNDELLSVSGGNSNLFSGWGVTLFDSLDTMWMMGLKEEFADSIEFVAAQNFTVQPFELVGFFETVIRYLGGLLSAYALSKETIFLVRADDLGRALLPAFNGTPSGFPAYSVNTQTGETGMSWSGSSILFAEAATCQMEYKYLAKLTGRKEYYDVAERVMTTIYESNVTEGLFPIMWGNDGTPMSTHLSVGAAGDSGYEYLLKQWLQSGDTKAREQYLISIEGIINNLFYVTPNRQLLYVTDIEYGLPTHSLEHLSCFMAGLLALGTHTLDLPSKVKERHQWAAEGLAYTCYLTYVDQESGLGPEGMKMVAGERWIDLLEKWEAEGREGGVPPGLVEGGRKDAKERDYWSTTSSYLLRPETVESLFVLWRTTGDVKWRERGYEIFTAIEKIAKTKFGYASIYGVDHVVPKQKDDMPSYFLAETLKYLYLLFGESDAYQFDKWVFNTEAHPLPVFNWTTAEKRTYNISGIKS